MIFAAVRCTRALAAQRRDGAEQQPTTPRVNFVFCLEGEGENGSLGFREAVLQNLEWMAGVVAIINTNNTWLGESVPCLTCELSSARVGLYFPPPAVPPPCCGSPPPVLALARRRHARHREAAR